LELFLGLVNAAEGGARKNTTVHTSFVRSHAKNRKRPFSNKNSLKNQSFSSIFKVVINFFHKPFYSITKYFAEDLTKEFVKFRGWNIKPNRS